jgi:hypothetical protein
VGVASAPQISDYGTWENCGGKDSSLTTPIAQPIGRGVFPSDAMPDLAFLILEMRAFSRWPTIYPMTTVNATASAASNTMLADN